MKLMPIALALTLLLMPVQALADDASLGRSGETVFPLDEPTVVMAAETVQLRIFPDKTEVDLAFTFANDGPAKSVLMGFPLKEKQDGRGNPELIDFLTWVDAQPADVQESRAERGGYPGWLTWTVPFAAGQTRIVTNRYWGRNSFWSDGTMMAGYILKTGATWKGPIGKADVTATLDQVLPADILKISPGDYRWVGDKLVWSWTNFEPDRDIEVYWQSRTEEAALRTAFLTGDATPTAKALLDGGSESSLLAYVAVKTGLRKPADLLGWKSLTPVMLRWLQAQAGLQPDRSLTPPPVELPPPPPVIPADPRPWWLLLPVGILLSIGLWLFRRRK